MRRLLLLLPLLLFSLQPQAARITDKLLAGLYTEARLDASPLQVLPSGTPFETLQTQGDFTRIRLGDNSEGWVESRFITDDKPARIMVLELQAKNSQLQQQLRHSQRQLKQLSGGKILPSAGSDGLAPLRRELADSRAETDNLRKQLEEEAVAGADLPEEIARLKAALNVSQQALNNTLNELNSQQPATELVQENAQLRQQINLAAAILGIPTTASEPPEPGLRFNAWHLPLLALTLLFSFIGGIAFKNYRLSKRYGGFRL